MVTARGYGARPGARTGFSWQGGPLSGRRRPHGGGGVVAASGEQYEFSGGGYRAVVTECGAGLRLLEHDRVPIVLGYPEDRHAIAGRGQLRGGEILRRRGRPCARR